MIIIGKIWFYMVLIGIIGSLIFKNMGELNKVILSEILKGIEFVISLVGIMVFWMGIMNIVKELGLIEKIG